jgi:hypothetical protein
MTYYLHNFILYSIIPRHIGREKLDVYNETMKDRDEGENQVQIVCMIHYLHINKSIVQCNSTLYIVYSTLFE